MKEYVLIKKSSYDRLLQSTSSNNSKTDGGVDNIIPTELQVQLENKKIFEETPTSQTSKSFSSDMGTQTDFPHINLSHIENGEKSEIKTEDKKTHIIPIYVNSLPKEHRERAREIVQDLVSRGVIRIDSNGYIERPGFDGMIQFEEFIRAIMIKNASLGANGMIIREIALDMNPDDIRNSKVLALIGYGMVDKKQNEWIRCVYKKNVFNEMCLC